jgi:hypothetical protein
VESEPYFVTKWLVSEVAERYKIEAKAVEEICREFDLPIVGEGEDKLILMYKPSVFINPVTHKKALAINFFSLPTLDTALRKRFLADYQGKTWFWHRFIWKLPASLFKAMENTAVFVIALFHSPKELFQMTDLKWKTDSAFKKLDKKFKKVNSCFSEAEINHLAGLMRDYYCSIIGHKGDILLVDNRKVVHTGMPGAGTRLVRALITNPLKMTYSQAQSGCLQCQDSPKESIGHYMTMAGKKK